MANINVTIRIDDNLKRQADDLFDELGLSFTTAVNMFVKQALRERALPFRVGAPEHPLADYQCISLDE